MTNYNERLDKIIENISNIEFAYHTDTVGTTDRNLAIDQAKQALTSLIKELALEVRLDELIWSTGVTYKYEKGRQIIQDRIAELKAKQEEV